MRTPADRQPADEPASNPATGGFSRIWRTSGLSVAVFVLAVLALIAPLGAAEPFGRVGLLLVLSATIEVVHGFRRASLDDQNAAWMDGGISLAIGVVLMNSPLLASSALGIILAGWFGIDAIRHLGSAIWRQDRNTTRTAEVLAFFANLLIAGLLLFFTDLALAWAVAISASLRMFGAASKIFSTPVMVTGETGHAAIRSLGLADRPEMASLAARITEEESARSSIDRGWILGFIATLFAIHVGRMGFDRSALGVFSPFVAVMGDVAIALVLAFVVVIPGGIVTRRLSRSTERRLWLWTLAGDLEKRRWSRWLLQAVLEFRLRSSIRLQRARLSLGTALSRGLQIGLPMAAIIAATTPVWGMSWYFDTENWAAGVWNSWAEERTDEWREAMVRAVREQKHPEDPAHQFAITPPGTQGDFSFIVIGDTGEGDATQHSLRAQYLKVANQEDVKFVLVSSDVVYPTGAMRNYEANFWLPFMGADKPVYAIPGNHDWYDALEAFSATFFEPDAARIAIRARVAADGGISTTTDSRIEELITTASRLSRDYRVPTQLQRAPYFQLQTESFALFALDTGVVKRIDDDQLAWFKRALESARGKLIMVVLGHPIYAGGRDQTANHPEFAALHDLLRQHDVAIVMAGDTHDLEYYVENVDRPRKRIQHFVNGGGGAYLSFGTSLAWPAKAITEEWAYYPSKADVIAKIDATTPFWKRPAWWWTRSAGAWPFSAEGLSAAFDSNVAPFMQSFVEVKVEPSRGRIRLIPHGVHGPLSWPEFDSSRTPDLTDRTAEWSASFD